jgi:eukaryotic-like serine/threonine-protein kinase
MSPEQARGLPVDKRADIWTFGCVLYEMLTGQRAFEGDRPSDVVAKIIEREPDLDALPRDIPPTICRLLRRCLEKDPRKRLRDIGDARLELAEHELVDDELVRGPRAGIAPHVAAAFAAVATATLAGAVWFWLEADGLGRDAERDRVTRFVIGDQELGIHALSGQALAIAPDGARVAQMTSQGLFIRERDKLAATLLARTPDPGAGAPFFSPDGRWVGFTDGQMLKKIPVEGGSLIPIVESGPAALSDWAGDEILFASMHGVFRVAATGGEAVRVPLALEPVEQAMHPQLLPDGRTLIVTIVPSRTNTPMFLSNAAGARVDALDLATGARRTLIRGGGAARYVPTGHLLYAAGDSLYAVAFDAERAELRGNPIPVVSPVAPAAFAIADDGTLVYLSGTMANDQRVLVWVDRRGNEERVDLPPRNYTYPRLSPDGTRVALDARDPSGRDIWMWHLDRKALERFTVDPAGNALVAWSPDGRRLVFGSDRFGVSNLFEQLADGSGEPKRLLESDRLHQPMSFAPDGRLIFSADVPGHGRDVHALAMDGSVAVESILHSTANDLWAEVSPDGRWIAYDSDESGQFEVYVRPYPDAYGGGRWQISSGGGREPLWSRDGRELFYRDYLGAMIAVPVTLAPAFAAGAATKLFDNASYAGGGPQGGGRAYDLSSDDGRFLMVKETSQRPDGGLPVVVVLNWFEELERLVPVR